MLYSRQSMRYLSWVNEDTWCTIKSYTLRHQAHLGLGLRKEESLLDQVCDGDRLLKPLEWYTQSFLGE